MRQPERLGRDVQTEIRAPHVDEIVSRSSSVYLETRAYTEEATMRNTIATPNISLVGVVGMPDAPLQPAHEAGSDSGRAAAHSNTIRPGRHVKARDLHPGDVVQQHDWSLHIREVDVGHVAVAIAVTEFGFPLHYAADEQVTLAA
jgi:hypothetical protein